MTSESHRADVESYYARSESRWGYRFLLGGRRHFGYYPPGVPVTVSEAQDLMERRLGERLQLPAGSRVLDAGCGEGGVAFHLAENLGYDVVGVDLLPTSIAIARATATNRQLDDRTRFAVADYSHLPIRGASMDGVFTMETLVHAWDHEAVLDEFARVLRPRGHLVVLEYTMPSWEELPPDAAQAFAKLIDVASLRSWPAFRNGTLGSILEERGFVDVVVEDVSDEIVPMLRWLATIGWVPYQLSRAFGVAEKLYNAMAGVEIYRHRHLWRYVIASARKP